MSLYVFTREGPPAGNLMSFKASLRRDDRPIPGLPLNVVAVAVIGSVLGVCICGYALCCALKGRAHHAEFQEHMHEVYLEKKASRDGSFYGSGNSHQQSDNHHVHHSNNSDPRQRSYQSAASMSSEAKGDHPHHRSHRHHHSHHSDPQNRSTSL